MNVSLKSVISLAIVFLYSSLTCSAEHPNTQVKVSAKLERIQGVLSPEVPTGSVSKQWKPKQWMMLEAKLSVQAAPEPATGYLDNMTVRFYVAAPNPEGKNSLLMSKEIKYVNIPVNQEIYVCVFMSPSSVKRLSGNELVGSNTFNRCGLEVLYKDRMVAFDTTKGKPGWWQALSPSLIPTESYPLLNKNETPFALFWYDRYPEIAPVKDSAARESLSPKAVPLPAGVPAPAAEAPKPAPKAKPAAAPAATGEEA